MQKIVLLTGATGNLGSRVMAELLKDNTVSLKLLVYGKTQMKSSAISIRY
jgi:thioester reductase-like protein